MTISYYETEDEMDEALENEMDTMQEEARLNAEIEEAEKRVDDASDAVREAEKDLDDRREEQEDAEQELEDLRDQLEALRDE